MSALTLFSVTDPQTPVWHSTDAKAIQEQLNAKGVRFERWQADRDLGADPSAETVIAAYQHAIDKLDVYKRQNRSRSSPMTTIRITWRHRKNGCCRPRWKPMALPSRWWSSAKVRRRIPLSMVFTVMIWPAAKRH